MIVKQTRPPGHSTKQQRASEWQANGKMERKVATEIRIYNWKMSADIRISRIDSFHTAIKTKYKEIKVQAQAQTVSHGDLPPETVNPELSAINPALDFIFITIFLSVSMKISKPPFLSFPQYGNPAAEPYNVHFPQEPGIYERQLQNIQSPSMRVVLPRRSVPTSFSAG